MSKEKLVPRLRFKDSKKDDKWESMKLGDIGNTFNGLSGKSKKDFGHGNAEFVTYMNVFNNTITNVNLTERVEIDKAQNEVQYGDVFFTTSSETPHEVGMSSVWLDSRPNVYLNSFCFGFRPLIKLSPYYLAYMLKSPRIRQEFIFLAQGISRYNISKTKAMEISVWMPNISEQNKISSFFKKIDKMIDLQQSKINKVKNIKSAYLSEMFPKEGEKYPKKRFEGFQGVWKKVRLKQVINQSGSGGTPRTTREEYYGGDIPFLGISDITNSNGYIFNTEKTITIKGLNNSAAWIVPKESISLAMYASVGKVAILKMKSATSQAFYNMVINNQPTRDYVYQYLVKMEAERMWDRIISTGTQANLNAEKVRNLIIPIPIDIVEREKIGQLFKNLDKQITIEEEKLSKLEKLKRAYLNDMFV